MLCCPSRHISSLLDARIEKTCGHLLRAGRILSLPGQSELFGHDRSLAATEPNAPEAIALTIRR